MNTKKKIIFSSIILIICFLIVELFVGTYYLVINKNFFSPSELFVHTFPDYLGVQKKGWECEYYKSVGPHPYLSYNLDGNTKSQCYIPGTNNFLMSGPDYPLEKDPKEFVVMLTGGSVADQMGSVFNNNVHHMTKFLNDRFYPPRGERFKVIVSAIGDYRFPQNLIGPILHHQIIDGVIDLSGFNETHQYYGDLRQGAPSPNYWLLLDREVTHDDSLIQINNRRFLNGAMGSFCKYSYSCFFLVHKYFQSLVKQFDQQSDSHYSIPKSIFQYPRDWNEEKRWEDRIRTHMGYYVILNQVCAGLKLHCSYFIQPIPQIGKVLTPEEKLHILHSNEGLAELYQRMVDHLLGLRKQNIPIHSLLDVFQNEKGTIYQDHIHYVWEHNAEARKGSVLVLQAMANILEKDWKLKRRK